MVVLRDVGNELKTRRRSGTPCTLHVRLSALWHCRLACCVCACKKLTAVAAGETPQFPCLGGIRRVGCVRRMSLRIPRACASLCRLVLFVVARDIGRGRSLQEVRAAAPVSSCCVYTVLVVCDRGWRSLRVDSKQRGAEKHGGKKVQVLGGCCLVLWDRTRLLALAPMALGNLFPLVTLAAYTEASASARDPWVSRVDPLSFNSMPSPLCLW